MNISIHDKSTSINNKPSTNGKTSKKKGKGKGHKKHLKPPRRAPRTYDEKVPFLRTIVLRVICIWFMRNMGMQDMIIHVLFCFK